MKRNRKVNSRSERADDNIFYNKVITWQLSSSSLEICSLLKSYYTFIVVLNSMKTEKIISYTKESLMFVVCMYGMIISQPFYW